MANTANSINQS